MAKIPDTRQSLLRRVKDSADSDAWSEFVTIYRPAVLRFALRRGLQPADAEDVTQRVFVAVAMKMKSWTAKSSSGSFRAWLLTVTRNAVINAVTRKPLARGAGGTSTIQRISQHPDTRSMQDDLDWEYRRAEFRNAANDVQHEFEPATWQAFWLTAVENRDVSDVAESLGKSTGSVYAARSRIMRRIKQRIELCQDQEDS